MVHGQRERCLLKIGEHESQIVDTYVTIRCGTTVDHQFRPRRRCVEITLEYVSRYR